jgi:5'(3')-deoxyribonucleotidase
MATDQKIIVYVDMDDVLCAFTPARLAALSACPEIKYPQSQYGFFAGLEAIPGGLEAIAWLRAQEQFSVYILTAPSLQNPLCYTEKRVWVEQHLGFDMVERLIISPDKGLNKGDYLIDDHTEGKGQDTFEGVLLHFGSPVYPDWSSILTYFQEIYAL